MTDHMGGNPHYGASLPDAAATGDGRAIADAILALAYEQRTATMIAYYTLWNRIDGSQPNSTMDIELQRRLGLTP